jgi:methylated-DNA-protein-cysteine methyltransferase-like protein
LATKELSPFSKKVIFLIGKIPEGKVATYGQIAKLAGKPHGSRGVAWILHSSSRAYRLPWQRVLGSQGKISFPWGSPSFVRQKRLLLGEGVEFGENDRIDLKKFQWKKKR